MFIATPPNVKAQNIKLCNFMDITQHKAITFYAITLRNTAVAGKRDTIQEKTAWFHFSRLQ
jgi:hypothetical protein